MANSRWCGDPSVGLPLGKMPTKMLLLIAPRIPTMITTHLISTFGISRPMPRNTIPTHSAPIAMQTLNTVAFGVV